MRIEAVESTNHVELAAAISSVLKDNYRELKPVGRAANVSSAAQYSQYSPQAFA